jgi:hypothetical protein
MSELETNNVAHGVEEFAKQSKQRLRIALIGGGLAVVLLFCAFGVAIHVAVHATSEIQQSRYSNCTSQNRRHDRSLAYVVHLAHEQDKGASPAKMAAIAVAVSQDKVLLQDLSPHVNCHAKTLPPAR